MSNLNHNPIIKNIPLKDIKPYSNNPRKKQNITKVVNSIKEFGFQQPIVVDKKNIIIVGHSRYEAGKELGLDKVPVIIADLSPVKAKAYRIADNRINQDSEWDFSKLKLEFKDISKLDFNLDSLGFEKNELDDLIIDEVKGFTDDDAVPDKPKKPKSKLGEIYQLGNHRLMCGDSTKEEDVKKLMNDKKADMVFTDPPYGVEYDGTHLSSGTYFKKGQRKQTINDNINIYSKTIPIISNILKKDKSCVYIFFADATGHYIYDAINDSDLKIRASIIWNKNHAQFGSMNSQYKKKHEPILYLYKKTTNWCGANNEITVWDIDRTSKNEHHPTQKPIALAMRSIKNHKPNIITDLFGGSGSTLIACEKTNRNCYMMELDPIYVDVIIKRWEDYTGKSSKKI
jgi:site-specific DNA-methyltransferase (adenine-specific)